MSRFFPHTDFAEEQPLPKSILTTHVLHRGFTSGALIGALFGANRFLLSSSYRARGPFSAAVLRSAGVGSLYGTALLGLALVGRMRGKEDIEWNDRSWRLLENKGQVEVDDWSLVGAAVGAYGGAMVSKGRWRSVLGGAGLGSLVGVGGYMVWRYGVRGGEERADVETKL